MLETFVHTFKSPINEYRALAVRHGFTVQPVSLYDGRLCYVIGSSRVRSKVGRSSYNVMQVKFLDGDVAMIPAGEWAKRAKTPPVPEIAQ